MGVASSTAARAAAGAASGGGALGLGVLQPKPQQQQQQQQQQVHHCSGSGETAEPCRVATDHKGQQRMPTAYERGAGCLCCCSSLHPSPITACRTESAKSWSAWFVCLMGPYFTGGSTGRPSSFLCRGPSPACLQASRNKCQSMSR